MDKAKNFNNHNIIGGTKETIDAIQRFLEKHSPKVNNAVVFEEEYNPSGSINKVINSIKDENIVNDIQKIINNL